MMDATQARSAVREAIGTVLRRDVADVSDDARLFDDLLFDSTSILDLLAEIEDRTGIRVEADQLDECTFRSVGTVTDFVLARLGLVARA
jgi:acyl carrier protein